MCSNIFRIKERKCILWKNVKEKKYLSFEEVMDFIKEMSYSTGLYGRLYRNIMETEESQEEFKRICEQEKFETTLDFVYWYEC